MRVAAIIIVGFLFFIFCLVVGLTIYEKDVPIEIKLGGKKSTTWKKFKDDFPAYGTRIKFRDGEGSEKQGVFLKDKNCKYDVLIMDNNGDRQEIVITENDKWRPIRKYNKKSKYKWEYVSE